jgi:uncharacterized repeat protein (TIGR01451 family)
MLNRLRYLWLVYWFLPFALFAQNQLTISTPAPRMVFQRNQSNEATVIVAGLAPASANLVEARFVPLAIGQGEVTAWTSLELLSNSSAFRGHVTVRAGWYRLDVRAKSGNTVLTQTNINRVGVGEVFLVAGQSNVYGAFERVSSAVDDRVLCLDFRQDSLSEQLLPLLFNHISYGASIGPSQQPHIWGPLGDKLVQRLNVPVMFLGAALGGTNITEWQQSAAGNIGTTPNASVYRRLGAALLHYVSRTGARAILWHQGESDLYTSYQTYYNNLKYIINKSRQQVNSFSLPWMVCRVSYINGQTSPAVISAQNQVIIDVPNVFPGPATDSITGPDNRPDGLHFKGVGAAKFTNTWDQSLTTAFFQNATPYTPVDDGTLITSGYSLPLTRRPGDMIAAASLRSNPRETDNQYYAQIIRADNGTTAYESGRTTDNPIVFALPNSLADGQYRLRTLSTHPAITGTLGEPFTIQQSASPRALSTILRQPVQGGTTDDIIKRFGYRYEGASHGFWALVNASGPVEIRIERIDSSGFADSNWNTAIPMSEAPDYNEFADFNYTRNYPPSAAAVGGVIPIGRYRYSVRRQGDSGPGLSYELRFLDGRNILYFPMEPIGAIPPVLTVNNTPSCLSTSFAVAIEVTDGNLNGDNNFSVRLSDASGSFAAETIIGSGSSSPIMVTLPSSIPAGNKYRIRVVASSPSVASAPSSYLSICNSGGSGADVSLSMQVSTRTPKIGQPITLTLVLTNDGPQTTDGVVIRSRLPNGIEFVDASSSGINVADNAVNINAGTLPSGTSTPFMFRLRANQSGVFATAAQVTASSQPDPDSQPNSGTGDGQDDAAIVDLRTPIVGGPLNVSPNPDQVPLPSVQSNQPPTDPSKANLSLAIISSSLLSRSGKVVSVTLTVSNWGGASASGVRAMVELPTGWVLTNPDGLTVDGRVITINLGDIPAVDARAKVLTIQPNSTGTMRAQVLNASPTDPNSTAGNGYTNGEDDEAALTLRMY